MIDQMSQPQPQPEQSADLRSEFWRVVREHAYQYVLLVVTIFSTLTAANIYNNAVFFSLCASAFLILFGGYIRALRAEEIKLLFDKLKFEQNQKQTAQREADQLKSRVELLIEQKTDLEKIRDYLVQQITTATDLLHPNNIEILKTALQKLGGSKS